MALAGAGSRRQCEDLIRAGRVEVDRKVVRELGTRVDSRTQEIRLDGEPLNRPKLTYFLLHKPAGVLCTNHDPSGRTRAIDLLPPMAERLFTVGRLDMSSEGLILLTNDGMLANQLAHPRYGVEKTYQVLVAGVMEMAELEQLCRGVHLAEGLAKATRAKVKHQYKQSTMLEIVLREGRNREIRRILAKVGHKVLRLKRVAIGGIRLQDLAPGEVRRLRADELRELRQSTRPATRPTATPSDA